MAVPHEVMFQNQLQFNLNVPLTTYNMATHFHHRPTPITIERSASHSAPNQGFPMAQLAHRDAGGGGGGGPSAAGHHTDGSQFAFSVLSQDRMAMAMQMAKRDMKNQKLKDQQSSRARSPSPITAARQKQIYGTKQWENRRSRAPKKTGAVVPAAAGKVKRMGVVKEHDKNRRPRSAGSQTPPSSPPRQAFLNTKLSPDPARSDSPPTRDTPSLTRVAHQPADDIQRLQLEMEMCLQQIQSVQQRALSEGSTQFLRGGDKRDCQLRLGEEEGEERRGVRAKEQAQRTLRSIYNLRQQVRQMDRQAVRQPRDTRPTKKSQASQRLVMVNKGAVKLLHNFVGQLPQQDLRSGLPSHFSELADLIRQVTLLSAGAPPLPQDAGKGRESSHPASSHLSPIEADVMAMVDRVEMLNCDWQKEVKSRETSPVPASRKPPFITNFKSTKSAFTKEQVKQAELFYKVHNERQALLREGIRAMMNSRRGGGGGRSSSGGRQKQRKAAAAAWGGRGGGALGSQKGRPYSTRMAPPPPPPTQPPLRGFGNKVPTRKPPPTRKGFLLPAKVRTQTRGEHHHHQQQHQHHASRGASLSSTHFADPTITANLKAYTMLRNPFAAHRSKSEPPSPGDRKTVNFIPAYAAGQSHHAHSFQRSLSPPAPSRLSRSHSPRVHFSSSAEHGRRPLTHSSPSYPSYHSDSEAPFLTSGDESSLSPARSVESFPGGSAWQGSRSPEGGRSHGAKRASRRQQRSRSPSSAQRRQFFVGDADPELVGELFPEDSRRAKTRKEGRPTKTRCVQSRRQEVALDPNMQEVERRVQERMASLARDPHFADTHKEQADLDRVADAILEEAILEATQEATQVERSAAAAEVAAAHIDNPTLENIMQALEHMEKENDRMRQKYSSVTFHDSVPRRRRYQKPSQVFAEFRSDQPRVPPAFEVTNTRPAQDSEGMAREFPSELTQEPLIFTKEDKAYRPRLTFTERGDDQAPAPQARPRAATTSVLRPKTLLSMKQTVVERIEDGVERFHFYQRGFKQHLGKHRPFHLYERVADNILWQCCGQVAQELEHINADMAENIYTSEFLSDAGLPLAPPGLAEDFVTQGSAARNLRDSAAAQRTVEAAVSKTVTSLMMMPPDEPELSAALSPKRVVDTMEREASPRWDTSLKHVYDGTLLYEASITVDRPAPAHLSQGGKGAAAKDDDTHVDYDDDDYDDDYTDISDEGEDDEDDDEDDEDGTESPSTRQ